MTPRIDRDPASQTLVLCAGCGRGFPADELVTWLTIDRGPIALCGACSDTLRREQDQRREAVMERTEQ